MLFERVCTWGLEGPLASLFSFLFLIFSVFKPVQTSTCFCQTVNTQLWCSFTKSASKDDNTNECNSQVVNFMYMVAIHFQGMPPLGGREGSPLSCGLAFCFLSPPPPYFFPFRTRKVNSFLPNAVLLVHTILV